MDRGLSYSVLNTARSAISSISYIQSNDANLTIGNHPLVKLFMRGVFNTKPQLPKTFSIWNPNYVLRLLKLWYPMNTLSLQCLSMKVSMLMLLSSGQRGQTILACSIKHMVITNNSITFHLVELLKTSKPGSHMSTLTFKSFKEEPKLCPVIYIKEYIKRTKTIRKSDQLLIQTTKPHKAIARATLRRWTKTTLTKAGVNMDTYKPHSTRAASTSLASLRDVPLNTILKAAGWKSDNTFRRFYKRPIIEPTNTFSNSIHGDHN